MFSVLIEKEATDILKANGLDLYKSVSCGFNRDSNNPNPDVVSYAVVRNDKSIFIYTARTTLSKEDIEKKNYGVDVLETCLNYANTNQDYQNQLQALMTALSASNNASSQQEYDDFEKICEDLNRYTALIQTKDNASSCMIDIEALEGSKELISKVLEQLKELEVSKQAVKA